MNCLTRRLMVQVGHHGEISVLPAMAKCIQVLAIIGKQKKVKVIFTATTLQKNNLKRLLTLIRLQGRKQMMCTFQKCMRILSKAGIRRYISPAHLMTAEKQEVRKCWKSGTETLQAGSFFNTILQPQRQ